MFGDQNFNSMVIEGFGDQLRMNDVSFDYSDFDAFADLGLLLYVSTSVHVNQPPTAVTETAPLKPHLAETTKSLPPSGACWLSHATTCPILKVHTTEQTRDQ